MRPKSGDWEARETEIGNRCFWRSDECLEQTCPEQKNPSSGGTINLRFNRPWAQGPTNLLCSVPVVPGGAALLEPHQGDACFTTCGMNTNKGILALCALASYHMFLAVALVQQGHGRRGLATVPSKMLCAVQKFVRAAVWTAIARSATCSPDMRSAPTSVIYF